MEKQLLFFLLLIVSCTYAQLTVTSSAEAPFEVGTQLALTCNFHSTDNSVIVTSYDWMANCSFDDECFSSSDNVRTISTVDRSEVPVLTSSDNGVYWCTVSLNNGSVLEATSYEVNVIGINVYEQTTNSILSDGDIFYADSNDNINVILHCIGADGPGNWTGPNGLPISGIVFQDNDMYGSAILSQGFGQFIDPLEDEGYYTCTARDENGMEHRIKVGLFFHESGRPPLNISLSTATNPALLNTSITLQCIANDRVVSPTPSYSWSLNNNSLHYTMNIITFKLDNATQYGVYACNISNDFGSNTDEINIKQASTVLPLVIPLDGDRHVIASHDDFAILSFRIDNAAPPVTSDNIYWYFSSSFSPDPYSNGVIDITGLSTRRGDSLYTYSNDNLTLNISSLDQTDEGRYFLVARNPAGEHYSHIDLIIHGPPIFIEKPSNATVINTMDVTFTYFAVADPHHNINWTFNDTKQLPNTVSIPSNSKYTVSRVSGRTFGQLTVHNVSYADRGVYQCTVYNYVASLTASAILTVHVRPIVYNISLPVSLLIESPLRLHCIATGYPHVNIRWKKNGVLIPVNTPNITMTTTTVPNSNVPVDQSITDINQLGSVGTLSFANVARDDTANYSCEAINSLLITGQLSAQSDNTSITVLDHPDPPTNVIVTGYTSRSITVSWVPAFNGNNPITGYFLYQKDLDRDVDNFILVSPSSPHFYTTQTETRYTVTSGIIPYTKYQFTVVACNGVEGTNCSSVLKGNLSPPVRIDPDAPDSPPYNCIAIPTNSTAIYLSWLSPLQPNGLIQNYTITYTPLLSISGLSYETSPDNTTTTDNNDTQIVINNLWKATSYNFSLRAFTVIGGSPLAVDICTNFTLEDNPDHSPLNINTISRTSTSVYLSWDPPPLFYQNGDIANYRIKYGINIAVPLEITVGDQLSTTVQGLSKYTIYTFTVSAGTAVGYGPESEEVIQRTLNDTSSVPRSLAVVGVPGRTNVTISWELPLHPNGIISNYTIYYQPYKPNPPINDTSYDPSERLLTVDSTTLRTTLTNLYPNSTYTISVTAINGAGESQRSTSVSTNTQSSPPPPPGTPMIPPNAVDGRTVRITLVKPSTINGFISHYQVIAVLVEGTSPPSTFPDILFPSIDSFLSYQQVKDDGTPNTAYIAAEFSDSLFPTDSMYTIGDVHQPQDRRYTNGLLRYGSSYTFFLRAYPILSSSTGSTTVKQTVTNGRQYTEFTSSNYTAVITTVSDPAPAIAISIGTALVVFNIVIVKVVIIVVVVYRIKRNARRRRRQLIQTLKYKEANHEFYSMTSDQSLPSTQNSIYQETDGMAVGHAQKYQYEGHPPISVGEFPKIVDRLHANDNYMFSQEYDEICRKSPHPSADICLHPMNKLKNRYANIQCYDHSRVKLISAEYYTHGYINANFLHGYKRSNEYIATQGPLPDTVGDFWRMVWDHNVPTIIMLTNLEEKMRVKCSQYWPDTIGTTEQFGYISVTFVKSTAHADYCIREFEIQARDQSETRNVRQYHYTSWPDFGVPRHATPLIHFIHTIRRYHKYDDTAPMIVHCSAGVGRTGVVVSIDVEMQRAENEGELCPYQFVRNLREDRNHMVQTEAQYIFLHDALVEMLGTEWTDISIDQLEDKMTELEVESVEGETGYSLEFNRLQEESQRNHFDDYAKARNDSNRDKNRIHNAIPYDHNRVKLSKIPGELGSDYINASFIDGYNAKNVFIATQGPLDNTVNDFWRMICEQQVSVIVMLTNLEERGRVMSVQYWPSKVGGVVSYGNVSIQLEEVISMEEYVHHQLKITYSTRDASDTRTVHHFNFIAWPKSGAPVSGAGMVDLIDQITKKQHQTGNKPIVVHCGSGVGRTGAFCALSIAIERVKVEQLLNVYSIVKHLRTQRAHMVLTLEQYIFIYRAVLEYAKSLNATSPYCPGIYEHDYLSTYDRDYTDAYDSDS